MDEVPCVINMNTVDYLFYHSFFPHEHAFEAENKSIQTKHTLPNQATHFMKGQKQRHIVLFLGQP